MVLHFNLDDLNDYDHRVWEAKEQEREMREEKAQKDKENAHYDMWRARLFVQSENTPHIFDTNGNDLGAEFPCYGWPGGYDIRYYVSDTIGSDSIDATLCGNCLNKSVGSVFIVALDTSDGDDDDDITNCDDCGKNWRS